MENFIYTPNRVWHYDEPSGSYNMTEEEIINRYYDNWRGRIKDPAIKLKYTYTACILDFITTYWAYQQ